MSLYSLSAPKNITGAAFAGGTAEIIRDPGDIFGPRYYHWDAGAYLPSPPDSVPIGETVGFYVSGQNLGPNTLSMQIDAKLVGPDGTIIATKSNEIDIDPGKYISHAYCKGIAFASGGYTGEVKLYVDENLADTWEGKVAEVPGGMTVWPLVAGGVGLLAAGIVIAKMFR